ncbi:MAG: hypothetical protein U0694_23775 [Anaerolineae bacterium]
MPARWLRRVGQTALNPETSGIPIMVVTGRSINADEQQLLSGVRVLSKTDITAETFENFISGVRADLSGENGA